jgi:hypothetical protein
MGKLTAGGLTAKLPTNDGDHGLRLNFRKLEDLIKNIATDGRPASLIAILFVQINSAKYGDFASFNPNIDKYGARQRTATAERWCTSARECVMRSPGARCARHRMRGVTRRRSIYLYR